jgi:hypothetical protein
VKNCNLKMGSLEEESVKKFEPGECMRMTSVSCATKPEVRSGEKVDIYM